MKKKSVVYNQIKNVIEKAKCKILSDDEKNTELKFTVNEPAISELVFSFEPERSLITLTAELALRVEREYQKDFAVFICVLNDGLTNGSFDCVDKSVYFRITSCIINKTAGEEVLINMINKTVNTVKANFRTLQKTAAGQNFASDYEQSPEKEFVFSESDFKKYETLCAAMDKLDWNYKKHGDELSVTFDVLYEDIPMKFIFSIDPRTKNVVMISPLPFTVTDESFYNVAYAAATVSSGLYDGTFCYNMARRELLFKMSLSYFEGDIDEKVFMYMVSCSISTVERFNDKFYELNNGRITIESFLKNMYGF